MQNSTPPFPQPQSDASLFKGVFAQGWTSYRTNAPFWTAFILIALLAMLLASSARLFAQQTPAWVQIVLFVSATLTNLIVSLGISSAALKLADGHRTRISFLTDGLPVLLAYLFGLLLLCCIVLPAAGLIAAGLFFSLFVSSGLMFPIAIILILFMLFLLVRTQFLAQILLDRPQGAISALRQSFALTKGQLLRLFLLDAALVGINCAGVLCFGIGLVVTFPLTSSIHAAIYRRLSPAAVNKSALSTECDDLAISAAPVSHESVS